MTYNLILHLLKQLKLDLYWLHLLPFKSFVGKKDFFYMNDDVTLSLFFFKKFDRYPTNNIIVLVVLHALDRTREQLMHVAFSKLKLWAVANTS